MDRVLISYDNELYILHFYIFLMTADMITEASQYKQSLWLFNKSFVYST